MPYADNKGADQPICTCSCYIQNFKTPASLCPWADRFESYLVANSRRQVFSWRDFYCLICKTERTMQVPTDISLNTTKPTKWHVRPAKTQISPGICPAWSESSLSAWRKLGSLATHWAHSEDSDQTGQMPRLIWVFARCTLILLVLSWCGSHSDIMEMCYVSRKDY